MSDSLFALIKANNMLSVASGNAKCIGTVLNAINHYSITIITLSWCFDWVGFAIDWVWVTMESLHLFVFANKKFHIFKRLASSTKLKEGLF